MTTAAGFSPQRKKEGAINKRQSELLGTERGRALPTGFCFAMRAPAIGPLSDQ